MSTKTVSVQLVALTQQYQKSMASATASTGKLQAASGAAGKSIGSVMGPQIAIAGAVVAGVAVKMALDFDKAFTKIGAITDASTAQVGQWKQQVMSLAGETARSPQELADALYFLASAGLDASEVMPALGASAKAAAVGLGDTADVARITANAMNAYSSSGLTAAQVTDTLVAAVREGTAEPEEFATALGRILPIASKAGISFDQVAASLSSVSNIGLDVNEGVTAMRGVLQALVAPTQQSKDELDALGLSAQDVRDSLANKGLIGTLRMLDKATGGDIDKMRELVPNVRALTGVFGLTTQEAKKVDAIFRKVQHSTGDTDSAFKKTADSVNFKLTQAFVDLQRVGIQLGDVLLPVVSDLASAVSDILGPLVAVIDKTEEFIAKHKTAGDVAGHVGDTFRENLIPGLGLLKTLFGDDAEAVKRFGVDTQKGASEAFRYGVKIAGAGDAADGAKGPVDGLGGAVKTTNVSLDDAKKLTDDLTLALKTLAGIALDAEDAAIGWHQALADAFDELKKGDKTLDITTQAGRDNRSAFLDAANAAIEHGAAVAASTGSVNAGVKAVRAHIEQLRQEAIAAGFTKKEIDDYIAHLKLTPKEISTLIKLKNKDKAQQEIDNFIRANDGRVIGVRIETTGAAAVGGGHQTTGHAGGIVGSIGARRLHSGGRIRADEETIIARRGEHILTAEQYRSLKEAPSVTVPAQQTSRPIRVGVRFDRRRFTNAYDHDATYSGRWS